MRVVQSYYIRTASGRGIGFSRAVQTSHNFSGFSRWGNVPLNPQGPMPKSNWRSSVSTA